MVKKQAIEDMLANYDRMKEELEEAKQQAISNAEASEVVQDMLE